MPMPPSISECVAALVEQFPIEDIWLLEANRAKECLLEKSHNLLLIVRPGKEEAHHVENHARRLVADDFPTADIDIYAFPFEASQRLPRPLLLKMAYSSGELVYCG